MTAAPTTWSASDLINAVTSAGNLVLTVNPPNGSSQGAGRGANPAATGLYYFEAQELGGNSNGLGVGIADAGVAISTIAAADGGTGTAICYIGAVTEGQCAVNGSSITNIAFQAGGDTVAVCADLNRQLVYFRDNAIDPIYGWNGDARWNGSPTANPSTDTGGMATSAIWGASGVTVYAAMDFVSAAANTQQVTLYSQAGTFMGPVPVGFTALGGTFNPSGIDPLIVLSNGNMTATVAAGSTFSDTAVLGTAAMQSGGKYYFEMSWDYYGGTDSNGISVCKSGYANQFVLVPDGRVFDYMGGNDASLGAKLVLGGLRVAVAVDLVNNRLWMRILGAQPASGLGGINIAPISSTGSFAPVGLVYGSNDSLGASFSSATGFTGQIPSGAVAWPGSYTPDVFLPPNVGFPVIRRPNFATREAASATGRRWRSAQRQYPTWKYTMPFEVLPTGGQYQGASGAALQYVAGFYVDQQGKFAEFLFQDIYTPDYQVAGGLIGYGDGATLSFPFVRAWRNTYEPVGWVNAADVSGVKLAGVSQASGWSVTSPNLLTFATPPAAGAAIAASFNFYWRCTFSDDSIEFEEFMADLFDLKELNFETLPSNVASALP